MLLAHLLCLRTDLLVLAMDNPQRLEDPTLVGQIINGLFENDVISRTAGDTAEEPPDERLQRLRAVTTGVIADALHRREIANSVQRPIPVSSRCFP